MAARCLLLHALTVDAVAANRNAMPENANDSQTLDHSAASCGAARALGMCKIKNQVKIIPPHRSAAHRLVFSTTRPKPAAISATPAKQVQKWWKGIHAGTSLATTSV